jgi:hypothetical protein
MINRIRNFLWIGGALHSRRFKFGQTEEPQFGLKIYRLTEEFTSRLKTTFRHGGICPPSGVEGGNGLSFLTPATSNEQIRKSLFETTSNIKGSPIWKTSKIKNRS